MSQGAFDFTVPPVDPSTHASTVPFQGSTLVSRHASYTGAQAAQHARSEKVTLLRQVWREPLTMQAVATITGLPLASVCSLKAILADELEPVGFDVVDWQGRTTKRTIWQRRRER